MKFGSVTSPIISRKIKRITFVSSSMEAFFGSMKREELYRTKYRSEREFKAAVDDYIVFYNGHRPHKKLMCKTPEQYEVQFYGKQTGSR